MKKQRIRANVADLILNEGQLDWLPENPRSWTRTDIDRTIESLKRDPDFQEDNPLKVVPLGDKLLVFAGNLRTTASKELGWDTFEAMLYEPETDEDKTTIKRRAILDNGSFGAWDYDRLANEWDDMPLCDFGVPAWHTADVDMDAVDALFEDAGPGKEKEITITITVPKLYEDKVTDIEEAIDVTLEEWPGCTVK